MNGKCLDIGTIQCFLDGETSQDESLRIGQHIANCEDCARLLAVADDENSFVFSTLDREMNALVPTQRLWTRINDSIKVERSNQPFWKVIFAFIGASLLSPTATSAAALLVVFGFIGAFLVLRQPAEVAQLPSAPQSEAKVNSIPQAFQPQSEVASVETELVNVIPTGPTVQHVKQSSLSSEKLENLVKDANRIRPVTADLPHYIPGEESYIKTIADLKETVDGRKDSVYTGSSRVAYERDLAVVNDSINRMRKVVKKNPRNQAARQVLYSAYQDKIDLLNSVAQKDELMATVD
jgi:hypothetical protein